jgi:dimethylargininase
MIKKYGGHSMALPLRRVMICRPGGVGWSNPERSRMLKELGYGHEPDGELAEVQHGGLREALEDAKIEVVDLPASQALTMDGVYTHDPSLLTDGGAITLRMGKVSRQGEPARHEALYEAISVPILGKIEAPGTVEGGDLVWLDAETLLVGHGYRTNAEGIHQLRLILTSVGARAVESPLPHGQGPGECLHLMSLMSIIDERTALVDLQWLTVPTVDLLRTMEFDLIEIAPEERATQATNVLSLGNKKLVAIEENRVTNERLRSAGFQVTTFPAGEICQNGCGGPTCLTRPILRD